MNIYVSDDIRKKWPGYEFVGKPFILADGKHYIRAYSKFHYRKHFYCYEDDWFWHDWPQVKKPEPPALATTSSIQ